MWRNLIKNCGRSLASFSPQLTQGRSKPTQRFLTCSTPLRNIEITRAAPAVNDTDPEYIVPYKLEYEKRETAKSIIQTLKEKFHFNKEEVDRILSNEAALKTCRENSFMHALDLLYVEGVKRENILEYPWLITLDRKKLTEKLNLLKSIADFRDINDFVPFLRLHIRRMRNVVSSLNAESKSFNNSNRVYFLADKLNLTPATVTKYLANRLFVVEMPLEMFKTNLQHMINYNVEPMSILKDLWGFRYSPKAVELRLQRASQAKKDKIMPWMVRCPEPILQKSLQLSLDDLKVLGDKTSVAEYVGERLGFSPEEAQAIMNRHSPVNRVRVTKIKEILDYVLDEENFTRYEVAQVPRIMCHSLETTKTRIKELKKYGCRPSSLVIVCRSKKEYEKFLDKWRQHNHCETTNDHVYQEDAK